jgi:hypothetical protein
MKLPDPQIVAEAHVRAKTAGEVRFIKDRGGDTREWAWNAPGPSEREIQKDFVFNAKYLKPVAQVLRSSLMALGHATSAHSKLVKVKSRNVSPDGSLGGKGYIQKITDMRRQLMNCIEVLSATSDTLYDELNAPHWNPSEDILDPRDREEVREIVEDVEEIKGDPEGWAEEQEDEIDEEDENLGKLASVSFVSAVSHRVSLDPCIDSINQEILTPRAGRDLIKLGSNVQEILSHVARINKSLALGKTNVR